MNLKGKKVGIALTGSFCTFEKMFEELKKLIDVGAEVYPILSDASQSIQSPGGAGRSGECGLSKNAMERNSVRGT